MDACGLHFVVRTFASWLMEPGIFADGDGPFLHEVQACRDLWKSFLAQWERRMVWKLSKTIFGMPMRG